MAAGFIPHVKLAKDFFLTLVDMQTKRRFLNGVILPALLSMLLFSAPEILARMMALDTAQFVFPRLTQITALPNLEQCTHKTGRLWFTVSNYGILGNHRDFLLRDCLTGGSTASAEFPGGSGVMYLFQGALWVGGIVGKDTLTSIGTDGWVNIRDFFPDAGTKGSIIRRSARKDSPNYSPDAVSDLDLLATYYDTLSDPRLVSNRDPETGEPRKPMGLKIEQRSYSWSAEWGQDWVFLDYNITNMGNEPIKKAYVGLFIDPDIGNINSGRATEVDDYCAFFTKRRPDSCRGDPFNGSPNIENLNIAYAYDNDGDPEEGDFGFSSRNPTGALGVRILRAGQAVVDSIGNLKTTQSLNWWVADSMGFLDWGPQKAPGRQSIFGRRGQPVGNVMKYYYLSNGEIDYDQVMSAINDPSTIDTLIESGWLPPLQPPISALDVANGADSRFLLSAGPFDIESGESVPVTFAVFAAPRFHNDPVNFATNFATPSDFQNPAKILAYKSALDFSGLFDNARMARKVFDNDTKCFLLYCSRFCPLRGPCGDLYVRRSYGDGIPDFKGPTPPPYPKVEISTGEGEVTIRWFGKETENARDPISGLQDFEGYSLQMSTDGINYTIIGYWDRVNWRGFYLNQDINGDGIKFDQRWEPLRNRPLRYNEIQNLYAVNWDTCINKPGFILKPIDPKKYTSTAFPLPITPFPNPWCAPDTSKTCVRVRFCDNCGPASTPLDTIVYFVQEGLNLGLNQIRMYPAVTDPDNDSSYWYQFKLSGLFPSQPVWFAVVPFDNGMVTLTQTIEPQSASPYGGAHMVYPIATDSARRANELKVSAYPNPYRIDNDYSYFEKPNINQGVLASTQKLNFINLPPKCTIRIYTLDGDLVQQIDHEKDPGAADAGYDSWDLLTRNAQKVASGLYLFTVESKEGRYVGKIMIIQ